MLQIIHRMLRNSDGHLRRLGHYCGTTGEPVLLRRPRRFTSGRSAGKPGPPIGRPKISSRLIGRLPVTSYLAADTFDFSCALPPSRSLGEQQRDSLGQGRRMRQKCQKHLSPGVWRRQAGIWMRQMQCIFAVRAGSGSPHKPPLPPTSTATLGPPRLHCSMQHCRPDIFKAK